MAQFTDKNPAQGVLQGTLFQASTMNTLVVGGSYYRPSGTPTSSGSTLSIPLATASFNNGLNGEAIWQNIAAQNLTLTPLSGPTATNALIDLTPAGTYTVVYVASTDLISSTNPFAVSGASPPATGNIRCWFVPVTSGGVIGAPISLITPYQVAPSLIAVADETIPSSAPATPGPGDTLQNTISRLLYKLSLATAGVTEDTLPASSSVDTSGGTNPGTISHLTDQLNKLFYEVAHTTAVTEDTLPASTNVNTSGGIDPSSIASLTDQLNKLFYYAYHPAGVLSSSFNKAASAAQTVTVGGAVPGSLTFTFPSLSEILSLATAVEYTPGGTPWPDYVAVVTGITYPSGVPTVTVSVHPVGAIINHNSGLGSTLGTPPQASFTNDTGYEISGFAANSIGTLLVTVSTFNIYSVVMYLSGTSAPGTPVTGNFTYVYDELFVGSTSVKVYLTAFGV